MPGKSLVEDVHSTAERVRVGAVAILDNLDTPQVDAGNPPGLDREALAAKGGPTPAQAPAQSVTHRQVEVLGL